MMTTPTDFMTMIPAELWIALFSHLYLPELVNVSATCTYFQNIALQYLPAHQALRSHYRRVGGYDPEDWNSPYWYPLLLELLRDPDARYYVEELMVEEDARWPKTQPDLLPEDEAMIREAVEVENWIPEMEKERFLDSILRGNEATMITLMVLQLPNLKRLGLARDFGFECLMPIVARIAQAAFDAADDRIPRPLSKLEHFQGLIFNGYDGPDFESIAPVMALPSLRTIDVPWNHERGFDWPPSLPKSHVRKIEITKGTVSREAILRLGKGIHGPCLIHQDWGFLRHDTADCQPVPDWSSLEIPWEDAGEEDWTVLFEQRPASPEEEEEDILLDSYEICAFCKERHCRMSFGTNCLASFR
ncbi:hypothetical protein C8R44DRAFT_765970 [Mycena epipterygia]|nr:hypothetical protein C8R44DRAFT_765970 [Mycena epipterygia]